MLFFWPENGRSGLNEEDLGILQPKETHMCTSISVVYCSTHISQARLNLGCCVIKGIRFIEQDKAQLQLSPLIWGSSMAFQSWSQYCWSCYVFCIKESLGKLSLEHCCLNYWRKWYLSIAATMKISTNTLNLPIIFYVPL